LTQWRVLATFMHPHLLCDTHNPITAGTPHD
jgi:hypothetical protein